MQPREVGVTNVHGAVELYKSILNGHGISFRIIAEDISQHLMSFHRFIKISSIKDLLDMEGIDSERKIFTATAHTVNYKFTIKKKQKPTALFVYQRKRFRLRGYSIAHRQSLYLENRQEFRQFCRTQNNTLLQKYRRGNYP